MSYRKTVSRYMEKQTQPNQALVKPTRLLSVDDLLQEVDKLLMAGSPHRALELISQSKLQSPRVVNATGVCQLRLGNAQSAVDIYRRLLVTGGIFLRPDAPIIFKVNFAVALLMSDNLPGFYSTLAELHADNDPAVIKVRAGFNAWKRKLTFRQRVLFSCGVQPQVPIDLGFPPGDLA